MRIPARRPIRTAKSPEVAFHDAPVTPVFWTISSPTKYVMTMTIVATLGNKGAVILSADG
jgi:hypothetical protein